jgi:hypothetical protein
MPWVVLFEDEFDREYEALPQEVQDELLPHIKLLRDYGPKLGRPHVDTLKGSKHANMKELRFTAANGVWRVAFAFDPRRQAVVLVAGDKAGVSEDRFYKRMIAKADGRFTAHLERLSKSGRKGE